MSQKQNKSRVFVVIIVIMVVAIIGIGLFLTWLIIEDGQKNNQTTFIEPSEAYVIEQEIAEYNSLLFSFSSL